VSRAIATATVVRLGGWAAIAGLVGCVGVSVVFSPPVLAEDTGSDKPDESGGDRPESPAPPDRAPDFASFSSPVFDEIRTTGVLRVAVASRAVPLSYRYPDGRLDGYCLDLIDDIAAALTRQLDLQKTPLVSIVASQFGTRFDLVRDGTVHLECGPNTIREVDGIVFSAPFLATGVQFISERGSGVEALLTGTNLGRVGALRDSSTLEFLRDRYADSAIEVFAGRRGIQQGIEALQGELDAFATDGLLTIGELAISGLSLSDYRIYPDDPLLCSPYGLLLPEGDPDWRALVDGVVTGAAGAALWETWFLAIDAYLQPAEEFCGVEVAPAAIVRDRRDRR